MSTKSREVICGGRIIGAKIRAQDARQRALSRPPVRLTGPQSNYGQSRWEPYSGPAQPSPNASTAATAGLR